jgi:hypothetical protein
MGPDRSRAEDDPHQQGEERYGGHAHYLSNSELRALRRLQRENLPRPHVFVSERGGPVTTAWFRKMMARLGERARMPFLMHPHMLRHSCGFKYANEGKDTRSLQAYLGHRNIQSTVRYTETVPDRGTCRSHGRRPRGSPTRRGLRCPRATTPGHARPPYGRDPVPDDQLPSAHRLGLQPVLGHHPAMRELEKPTAARLATCDATKLSGVGTDPSPNPSSRGVAAPGPCTLETTAREIALGTPRAVAGNCGWQNEKAAVVHFRAAFLIQRWRLVSKKPRRVTSAKQ